MPQNWTDLTKLTVELIILLSLKGLSKTPHTRKGIKVWGNILSVYSPEDCKSQFEQVCKELQATLDIIHIKQLKTPLGEFNGPIDN